PRRHAPYSFRSVKFGPQRPTCETNMPLPATQAADQDDFFHAPTNRFDQLFRHFAAFVVQGYMRFVRMPVSLEFETAHRSDHFVSQHRHAADPFLSAKDEGAFGAAETHQPVKADAKARCRQSGKYVRHLVEQIVGQSSIGTKVKQRNVQPISRGRLAWQGEL